jgi:hypothetical protein
MGSNTRERDFSAYEENNYPGMIIPEMFNNSQDIGDGYPGLQGAIRNWVTWWLHSGNMDSGLHLAGYDITGVENVIAQSGTIIRGIISPRQDNVVATFTNGTQEGELYWSEVDEALYRWHEAEQYWIQIGG